MTVFGKRQQTLLDYEGFVEKFKPKKTTDDCMTPDAVYEAVKEWAVREYNLAGREIVRPFWPGGDFEMFDYPTNCVVIDNPPFSKITPITRWYDKYGVDYFIFAPHLTNFASYSANHVLTGVGIVYANGANVKTSFLTSLGTDKIRNAPALYRAIMDAQKQKDKPKLNKYLWSRNVMRTTQLDALTKAGVEFSVSHEECLRPAAGNLDCFAERGARVFGGCYLISDMAADALDYAWQKAISNDMDGSIEDGYIEVKLSKREQEMLERVFGGDNK